MFLVYFHPNFNFFILFNFVFYFDARFSLIDEGKNPDEFTKDVIMNCVAKNQITKGKSDALKV